MTTHNHCHSIVQIHQQLPSGADELMAFCTPWAGKEKGGREGIGKVKWTFLPTSILSM